MPSWTVVPKGHIAFSVNKSVTRGQGSPHHKFITILKDKLVLGKTFLHAKFCIIFKKRYITTDGHNDMLCILFVIDADDCCLYVPSNYYVHKVIFRYLNTCTCIPQNIVQLYRLNYLINFYSNFCICFHFALMFVWISE